MQHTVIYFPDYRHANPYQWLLYSHLDRDFHVRSGCIAVAPEKVAAESPKSGPKRAYPQAPVVRKTGPKAPHFLGFRA